MGTQHTRIEFDRNYLTLCPMGININIINYLKYNTVLNYFVFQIKNLYIFLRIALNYLSCETHEYITRLLFGLFGRTGKLDDCYMHPRILLSFQDIKIESIVSKILRTKNAGHFLLYIYIKK